MSKKRKHRVRGILISLKKLAKGKLHGGRSGKIRGMQGGFSEHRARAHTTARSVREKRK